MFDFLLALSLFLFLHLVPSRGAVRARLVHWMGERRFVALSGVISLVLFIWVIMTAKAAPFIEVWPFYDPLRWVPLLIMPFFFVLLVCAFSQPNPYSLGRGALGYDPDNPGIVGLTRHPALAAFGLWAVAHMVVNGDLVSLIFFGLMAGLSLYGVSSLDQKRRKSLGDRYEGLMPRGRPRIGWGRWLAALILYGMMLAVHEWLFGVVPYFM